ncbi:C2H2 type zinc-finger-domain-containing protein [Paraphysoderma sedebokerense]|nr:C2H2 type zinc-finger-domain-containing protein [Paraphysoderma sedebokerense]
MPNPPTLATSEWQVASRRQRKTSLTHNNSKNASSDGHKPHSSSHSKSAASTSWKASHAQSSHQKHRNTHQKQQHLNGALRPNAQYLTTPPSSSPSNSPPSSAHTHAHAHAHTHRRRTSVCSVSSTSTATTTSSIGYELSNTYILPEPFMILCPFDCPNQNPEPYTNLHALLEHLAFQHGIKILDVAGVGGVMARYLDWWGERIKNDAGFEAALKRFNEEREKNPTAAVTMGSENLDPLSEGGRKLKRKYAIVFGEPSDLDDRAWRTKLQKEKLAEVLKIQEQERAEEAHLPRKCLFCKTVCDNRVSLFKHMFTTHSFNIGLPDNIVYVNHFLDLLSEKLANLQCLYCERTFKSSAVLRKHMRKKRHFRISPKNKDYDRFYIINYLEAGKNWETLQSKDHYFSSDDESPANTNVPSVAITQPPKFSYSTSYGTYTSLGSHTGTYVSHASFMTNTTANGEGDESDSWSDWNDEMEKEPCQCLFCDEICESAESCAAGRGHMVSAHGFDLKAVKDDLGLTLYQTIILINYIRRCSSTYTCFACLESPLESSEGTLQYQFDSIQALTTHMTSNNCFTRVPKPPSQTVEVKSHVVPTTSSGYEQVVDELAQKELEQVVSGLRIESGMNGGVPNDKGVQERWRNIGDTVVVVKGLMGGDSVTESSIENGQKSEGSKEKNAEGKTSFWNNPQYLFPTFEGDPLLTFGDLDDDDDDNDFGFQFE